MSNDTIPMYTPCRDYHNHQEEYDTAIKDVLETGQFINGPKVTELENSLAQFVGSQHCVALSSGTDALLIALMALGVGPGDEVITVAHTWISSSEVISVLGAVPVFIDIDPDTFIMNLDHIESVITDRTVGIMPVQIYGNMVDIDRIQTIAQKHNLWIIEDGAQSFGSSLYGVMSNSWSTIGCTSFFPSKPLGAYGDAGACFTNDEDLYLKIKAIKNHGGQVRFKHDYIGLNARMDALQASILQVKLNHFPDCLARRQWIANYYTESLKNTPGIKTPKHIPGLNSAWAQYSLLVEKDDLRDTVVEKLKAKGLQISIFYPKGLHEQPCFEYLNPPRLPMTDYVCSHIVNVPLFAELTDSEVDSITQNVKSVMYDLHKN